MRFLLCTLTILLSCALSARADAPNDDAQDAIRARLGQYLDAFNAHNATKVAGFWAKDAVSLNEETGERTTGRDAIGEDFEQFFNNSPGARLTGEATHIRFVRPDVAIAEGQATLFTQGEEPVTSAFTAVLIQEDGQWLLESSQERAVPTPASPADALQELAWLVGQWEDQTDEVEVTTTVRWSANNAFLIRSYFAQFGEGDAFEGTQVIGWDPRGKQFRTWSFNSDGSFADGIASKSGDAWLIKMTQVQSDGALATATQVITRVDENTMTVQKIGQTLDGSPLPASSPVTVVRVAPADAVSQSQEATR